MICTLIVQRRCKKDPPAQALNFPPGVDSYRTLRLQRTTAVLEATQEPRPPPDVALRPAQTLPSVFHGASGLFLPSLGWHCSLTDAADAAACGARLLLFADGDPQVESVLGGTASTDAVLCTSATSAVEAERSAARLGRRPSLLLLRWDGEPDASLEAAWADVCGAAGDAAVGLHCPHAEVAQRALGVLLRSARRPTAVATPISPSCARRALMGFCRRSGILVLALSPLAGPADGVEEGARCREETLLAWGLGRGCVVIPSDAEGVLLPAVVTAASRGLLDISSQHRARIDALSG